MGHGIVVFVEDASVGTIENVILVIMGFYHDPFCSHRVQGRGKGGREGVLLMDVKTNLL